MPPDIPYFPHVVETIYYLPSSTSTKDWIIFNNNFVSVDLTTGMTQQTDYDIIQEQIETSATILANILLDYVKQHGTTILSPERVFGKGEQHNE